MIKLQLPIVLSKEGKYFVAECPLFYVGSQGKTLSESIENIKEALELYLSDEDVQGELPNKIIYSKEEVVKRAEDLFKEFCSPEDMLPKYTYKEIMVMIK